MSETQNIEQGYQMMKLTDIVTREEFSGIFPIEQDILTKIIDSIFENGYDKSQPVTLWEFEKQKYVLIDGHTRKKAAEKNGLKEIPATVMQFNSLEEAQQYTYKRQAERRNLNQGEILQAAMLLKNKEKRDGTGRSVEKLSKEMGVSPSTLVHAKTVAEKANEEDINAIKKGDVTINSVYQKIKIKKPEKENVDNNSSCTEKTNKIGFEIEQPKSSLANKLIDIEDILRLLKEYNENNAISIILEKYKDLKIRSI